MKSPDLRTHLCIFSSSFAFSPEFDTVDFPLLLDRNFS